MDRQYMVLLGFDLSFDKVPVWFAGEKDFFCMYLVLKYYYIQKSTKFF